MAEQENSNWKNIIVNDVNQISNNYDLNKLNSKFVTKKYRLILKILLTIAPIILATGIAIFKLQSTIIEDNGFIKKNSDIISDIAVALIALGSILLALSILLTFLQSRVMRIQREIINKLNIDKYYALAITQATNNKYNLVSLRKEFDLAPHSFLPSFGISRTDNVLNISGQGIKLSFGTITNEVPKVIATQDRKARQNNIYTRFCYLTLTILKENEVVATIQKSTSHLNISKVKPKDNTNLESNEFEKIFAVEANDQILIRKLLVPKVIANLVDKANNEKNIPAIEFNKQNLTICSNRFRVLDWLDPEGTIAGNDFFITKDKDLATALSQKINDDINIFLSCLSWVEAYEVI